MVKAIKELEEKKHQKDGLTGVPTGFSALDPGDERLATL